ncbi:MAG TPA: lipopolysaccharide transport periplasmic protein LptA [Woeseiaceae bacterium]|nr:lipopolysaccharide transport periplasmic protein LptA [Woeseiaceae bacterium]
MLTFLLHAVRNWPLLALLCVLPAYLPAQIETPRLPISLDADFTDLDGKNSMLTFRGLRLTQGNLGVEADVGRASELDFEDSVWQFSGNVKIDTGNGHIECNTADLHFSGHRLQVATITGEPATFELKRPQSDKVTYAEADKLEYDFDAGVIEFTGNATITEGGNRISSDFLLYNIREQRINAQSAGADGDKVRITYTPAADPGARDDVDNATPPEDDPGDGPP